MERSDSGLAAQLSLWELESPAFVWFLPAIRTTPPCGRGFPSLTKEGAHFTRILITVMKFVHTVMPGRAGILRV
jgi:hypothetical protein